MILESLVTTVDAGGCVNLAPMGPRVDERLTQFLLKPFKPSITHDNLFTTRKATIHVSDNVVMFARSVMGTLTPPAMTRVQVDWWVIEDCCRYFLVEVDQWTDDDLRATARCRVIESGEKRPFFGFNRAKHAVIEACILATRTHLIPKEKLLSEMDSLQTLIEKTAGDAERTVFEELKEYVAQRLD